MAAYTEAFAELTLTAEKRLRWPEIDLPQHNQVLRLWRYPSFEPYVSWLVYSPVARYRDVNSSLAVRVSWDRPFDTARFRDPMKGLAHGSAVEPAITLKQIEIPVTDVDSRLATLASIKVPVMIDRSIVVDGEICGFESFGLTTVRLTWCSNAPDTWQPIVDWAAETIDFLEQAFERQSIS